jgi:hypothetical protein
MRRSPAEASVRSPALPDANTQALQFFPGTSSEVKLEGTSTIGMWTCRSGEIQGRMTLDADEAQLTRLFDSIEAQTPNAGENPIPLNLAVRRLPVADISVPVMSLHGDSIGMDHDMQNALKAAEYPAIEYVFQNLKQVTIQHDPASGRPELKLSTVGSLHMAGAERTIPMNVIVRRDATGHFLVRAQATMMMTDFGVTPPVALFGLIKGGDEVRVFFYLDLVLNHN